MKEKMLETMAKIMYYQRARGIKIEEKCLKKLSNN